MHLPASKDGTSSGLGPAQETVLDTNVRKLDGSSSTPASPSSPPKAMSTREKPQKVLPCPRCESMNTKFCYYNNYSVNQPRHFCRQCQRYWTVGGTLRNVPVGGGSRKKNRHQQRGEPYLIRTGTGPLAMAPATSTTTNTTTTTTSGINMAPPLNTFPHDLTGFNFSQLPGFVHPVGAAYSGDQPGLYINSLSSKPQEFAAMQPMYGAMNPHTGGGSLMYPDLAALQLAEHHQNPGAVKAEFWGNHHVMHANWNGNLAQVNQGDQVGAKTVNSAKSGSYDSSMLLHLGLNSRPHMNGKPAPWTSNNNNQENHHTRGGHAVNGTSPPHGSSTIEEEGSTPTNGYSNSGYEEGDTVSSMWQEMHDMQDIFQ